MRRLRILHVTPYFSDAWAYGGIPRVASALARGLAERGHDVTVCSTDAYTAEARLANPERTARLRPHAPFQTPYGVTVRVFPNLSNQLAYQQLFAPVGLGAYLRKSAGSFDIAHLHACRNLPGIIAARHLRRAGVPYVLAPNGTAPRIERRFVAKRAFDLVAGNGVLARAARVLAVSEAERAQLHVLGVARESVRLVPNPVDLSEFAMAPVRGRFRSSVGITGPLVLFLGRLTPRKRLDVVVRAFARLIDRSSRLVIAGNDAGAAGNARRLANALGVADRVQFTGLLSGRDRLDALSDADVVVYPSQDEVFGLVPLEGLLCGTPAVVAGDSGCAEIMHAVGGPDSAKAASAVTIVQVGDSEALARAITSHLQHPEARAATSEAAARIRDAYSIDTVCETLDDVYQELVRAA